MKNVLTAAAVLALSSVALADKGPSMGAHLTGESLTVTPSLVARAGERINVGLLQDVISFDTEGDTDNISFEVDLDVALEPGEFVVINGIGWDVALEAFDPSFLDEMVLGFANPGNPNAVILTPGVGEDRSGRGFYENPVIKLADVGVANLELDSDVVRFEFFEAFDDGVVGGDGRWLADSVITIQYVIVPTPGAAALFAAAGLVGLRRRR